MKKSDSFILKEVAGNTVLVPFGEKAVSFDGIITLNDSAKFIWENTSGEFDRDSITEIILKSYEDVEREAAEKSADKFITALKEVGAIE